MAAMAPPPPPPRMGFGGPVGGCGGGCGGVVGGGAAEIGQFLMTSGIDDKARQALAGLDVAEQRIVAALVSRGGQCRNPSAVTWSRIKLVRERPDEARRDFLRVALDAEALAGLERLSPEEQAALIAQVDIANCRNISAFVWSKVKSLAPPPVKGVAGAPPGRPATPVPGARPSSRPVFGGVAPKVGGDAEDVETMAASLAAERLAAEFGVALDDRCLPKFRNLSEAQQQAILESIPVDCRNPSAFVWSKVKAATPMPQANGVR